MNNKDVLERHTERLRKKQSESGHSKKRKTGKRIMVIGLILVLCALCLVGYNMWDSARAGGESDTILAGLDDGIPDEGPVTEPDEMPTITIDGYEYIGELSIPGLDIRLPVMADWDYTRLKISPCRYSGSYLNNDLVICAHNYSRHFSPIKWIGVGEPVYFIAVDGRVYEYTVTNRETLQPTDVELLVSNQNNSEDAVEEWDLSLFTCNTGGRTRCVVRCSRVE